MDYPGVRLVGALQAGRDEAAHAKSAGLEQARLAAVPEYLAAAQERACQATPDADLTWLPDPDEAALRGAPQAGLPADARALWGRRAASGQVFPARLAPELDR
jgi:hypothetical protein